MITTERQTYSILEWLGDVGGLFDGLMLIGKFFILPIGGLALKLKLLTTVFLSAQANVGE